MFLILAVAGILAALAVVVGQASSLSWTGKMPVLRAGVSPAPDGTAALLARYYPPRNSGGKNAPLTDESPLKIVPNPDGPGFVPDYRALKQIENGAEQRAAKPGFKPVGPDKYVRPVFPGTFSEALHVRTGNAANVAHFAKLRDAEERKDHEQFGKMLDDVSAMPVGANAQSKASVSGDGTLVYQDAFPGCDVAYRASALKTEEYIIIKSGDREIGSSRAGTAPQGRSLVAGGGSPRNTAPTEHPSPDKGVRGVCGGNTAAPSGACASEVADNQGLPPLAMNERASGPAQTASFKTFSWNLDVPPALKPRLTPAQTIEFVDKHGVPRLRINAPEGKDADGKLRRVGSGGGPAQGAGSRAARQEAAPVSCAQGENDHLGQGFLRPAAAHPVGVGHPAA